MAGRAPAAGLRDPSADGRAARRRGPGPRARTTTSTARSPPATTSSQRMRAIELAFWVNVPLVDGETLLGSIGLGLRASRPDPTEQRPFLRALGDAAAVGLANAHLVGELRRTRGRLERILGALSEAVTVNDGRRARMVYANEAAARLLGARSVDEVLATHGASELAARFHITREDGRPVSLEDCPAMRVLARRRVRGDADPQRAPRDREDALAAHQGDAARRRGAPRRQHHRGRQRGQGRRAAPALPRRGELGPRLHARLRAHARARRARSPSRRSPTGAPSTC